MSSIQRQKEVAGIIRQQIETGVLWSLGASEFTCTDVDGDPGLAMIVRVLPYTKSGKRGSKARRMRLTVTLNDFDYYDVEVTYLNGMELVLHERHENVDVASLNRTLLGIDSMDDRS